MVPIVATRVTVYAHIPIALVSRQSPTDANPVDRPSRWPATTESTMIATGKPRIEHAFAAAPGTLKIDADYIQALTM